MIILILLIQLILAVLLILRIGILGGSFHPLRFAIALSPYLILPPSITFILQRNETYIALAVSIALVVVVIAIWRIGLRMVPDPIEEYYGNRPTPYSGFLVLPSDAVPPGFRETSHHYSRVQYCISFIKSIGDNWIRLSITEGAIFNVFYEDTKPIKEFLHNGVVGYVYECSSNATSYNSLHLIWFNPPKQRVSIYFTQTNREFESENLIKILTTLKLQ